MSLDLIAMGKYVDDSSSSSSSDSDSDDNSSNNSSSSSSSSSSSANSSPASSPASSPVVPVAARKALTTASGKVRMKPGPKPKAGPKAAPAPKPKARTQRAAAIAATARFEEDDDDFESSPPPPPPSSMPPPPPPPPPSEMEAAPKKKRAAPVKRAPSAMAAKKKQKVQDEVPPPPPPPASPPPPPPSDDSSSNSSSMESSDSSSSSDSDDFDETIPRRPSSTKSSSSSRVSPSSARSKASMGASDSSPLAADALKVKLKLPPGFIAKHPDGAALKTTLTDRGKLKVQVTNSQPPAKKQKTPTSKGAAKKATPTASKTKAKSPASKSSTTSKKSKKGVSQPAAPMATPPGSANGTLNPAAPVLPVWQPILEKLIPKGPTLPVGEVRGKRELQLVGYDTDHDRPEEVPESELSVEFNDPFAVESDALRNLDLFFFCDEFGNAIGLDILEKPKHERPKIMGFGTVVQHLPPTERPLPVKYILPSPAFPSRNRKRPRSDSAISTASPPVKPSKSRSNGATKSTSKKSPSKRNVKSSANGSAIEETLPQLDGHDSSSDVDAPCSRIRRSDSIFNAVTIYERNAFRGGNKRSISQLDGLSDSDDSSSASRSGRDSSRRGSDSEDGLSANESVSGSSGSGSESESGNESDEHDQVSTKSDSSRVDTETAATSSSPLARDEDVAFANIYENNTQVKDRKKSTKSTSPQKHMTTNPDVDELMRTDREGVVKPRGTEDELNLLECGFRHPHEYKRARVWLPEISDWCLDYSEGDPTLWVITPHAWYKVAGPLSGMLPHPSYREKFQHVRKLFEASYLVAYVLKEWLPINKKVSYRSTLQQIVELSLKGRYPVSGWFLMENCQFIQHQICDLVADKEAYLDSMFFKQLQRMYEAHRAREERVKKDLAEREEKRLRREDEKIKRRQQQEEERRKLQDKKDEERKVKEAERRYPMEDSELLLEEGDSVAQVLPVTPAPWMGVDGFLLGDMIVAWQTICTFKDFISLEPISLDELTACITSKEEGETDITLIRIFMAFLKVILSEKSFVSPMDDLVVEGSTTVADLFVNTERTYGICERPYIELLNAVSWQDILRQLMAKDLDVDASIGSIEPLVGCEIVRQTLYMQNNSVPFNAPVDTKIKGLEDYLQVIKNPMDLGTVKQKMDAGQYEGENGHELFAKDVRLIWDNALFFNGEESEVGKAALALSDIFEQDYQRLVAGRISANKAMLEESREVVNVVAGDTKTRPRFVDIVHALYSFEFHQLPVPFKIGALSWICSEFLKLDSVRSHIESQAEREFEVNREFRRKAGDIDSRRKQSERNRRERDAAFKKDCAERGIEPNANNHFSDAVKQEHPFIAKFYEDIRSEKAAEDAEWQRERRVLDDETRVALEGVIVRESPLGRDRFHNSYWVFKNDSKQRLFIEKSDSGEFIAVTEQTVLEGLLSWLNPKGIRESDLIAKLKQILADLIRDMVAPSPPSSSFWGSDQVITLNLFPLPGEGVKSSDKLVLSPKEHTPNAVVMKRMLSKMYEYVERARLLPQDWDSSKSWKSRVEASPTAAALREQFAEIEAAIFDSRGGAEMIRPSWKRKRREWRLSLEGSCTISQLVFLLHLFLAECINIEAFTDLSARLDRKEWFKLRSKECRNFIPEIGKNVIYFGDGHSQAVKEDAKAKKKKFTRKCDSPLIQRTLLCQVADVSYYHGGGDPYALLTLHPQDKMDGTVTKHPPGTLLCPQPSPLQRLGRILQRVLAKLKLHGDAGPFLEPVSDRDFPEYKEIIPHPMDLGKITAKARANQYKKAEQFMSDIRLMSSNCALFCEGRFPSLPPLAENVVDMAEAHVKKFQKELRVYEKAVADGVNELNDEQPNKSGSKDRVKEVESSPSGTPPGSEADAGNTNHTSIPGEMLVVLRLENRLPEYIIDVKRYEAAVSRTWRCGQKFKMLFRDPKGYPGEYYSGVAAGSLPFDANGLLPWEALRVVWDEDDGSDSRINPWEAEMIPEGRKGR